MLPLLTLTLEVFLYSIFAVVCLFVFVCLFVIFFFFHYFISGALAMFLEFRNSDSYSGYSTSNIVTESVKWSKSKSHKLLQ